MNITSELVSPPTSNANNDTSTIGPEKTILQEVTEPNQKEVNKRKQKDRKDKRKEKKQDRRKERKKKKEEVLLTDTTTNKPSVTEKLTSTGVNVTTPALATKTIKLLTSENHLSTSTNKPSTTEKQVREATPLPMLVSTGGMLSNNNAVKIVTPEFIRKLQESLQAKLDKIQQDVAKATRNTTGTNDNTTILPTTKSNVQDAISPRNNVTQATETKTISVKIGTTIPSTTVQIVNIESSTSGNKVQTSNTTTVSQTTVQSRVFETSTLNSVLGNVTVSSVDVSSPTQGNNETNVNVADDKTEDDTKVTTDNSKSGLVIVQENKSNSTDVHDIDIIIFPSSRADEKKRRRERRKFCRNIDFGSAAKGFNCCKKTLNCFDELPDHLDETIFHHANPNYNEAERIHVCHHIDDSFTCIGEVMGRTVCQDAAQIMNNKIKPQLDQVKLFYYNTCNRGGPTLTPPAGPHPTTGLFPHKPPRTDTESGFQANKRGYAPFIGGAIIGLFALMVIILFTVYCRKRNKKRKKNKEKRKDKARESTESSRYKTVSYTRRKSDIYAEIDEKNMVSTISCGGHSCSNDGSCYSSSLISSQNNSKIELDNNGYLSPEPSILEDVLAPDIKNKETNLFTHGYIELTSESGDSAQSYAKLEPDPEDDYIQADKIESSPNRTSKKADEQGHMYFVLEKDNKTQYSETVEN